MNYESGYLDAKNLADRIRSEASTGKSVAGLGGSRRKKMSVNADKYGVEDPYTGSDFGALTVGSISSLFEDVEANDLRAYLDSLEEDKPLRPVARAENAASSDLETRTLLAKTIQAEAGGEDYEGKLAVGSVIANRVKSKGYGNSYENVILAPGQFSAWNSVTNYAKGEGGLNMDLIKPSEDAYKVADAILSGSYESPVGDATHYYNPAVADPNWGEKAGGDWQGIGNHIFGYGNKG